MISDVEIRWKFVLNESECEELMEALKTVRHPSILITRMIRDLESHLENQGYYEE